MDMDTALTISAKGMQAQTARLKVIAQNLANQDSTGSTPGAPAYRRKTITFREALHAHGDTPTVEIARIGADPSALPKRYDPSNPAADSSGYVQTPNVNSFVEVMDMRAAQRGYDANLAVMQTTRGMLLRTIEMLK